MTAPIRNRDRLQHIRVDQFLSPANYRPRTGGSTEFPVRNRQAHGIRLVRELGNAVADAKGRQQARAVQESVGVEGFYLELESANGFPLPEMEWKTKEIRLSAIRNSDPNDESSAEIGALFVPITEEGFLSGLIDTYTRLDTRSGNPQQQARIAPLEHIRPATAASLWTDSRPLPERIDLPIWWECWCWKERAGHLRQAARSLGLQVSEWELAFPDLVVVSVYGNHREMDQLLLSNDAIAELRAATDTPVFFMETVRRDQRPWTNNLRERLVVAERNSPAVCILDHGVAWRHPLIEDFLDEDDCLTVVEDWGKHDHHPQGHGTNMAGTTLYGDLTPLLADESIVEPGIRLESVKFIPPDSAPPTDRASYGAITQQAVSRAEINKPERLRTFCMAITTNYETAGAPTSWSAAIDQICSGTMPGDEGSPRRLFMISAGNIPNSLVPQEIADPRLFPVEDPAQSWNGITIGGYSEKQLIDDPGRLDWVPASRVGDRSHYSRISTTWENSLSPIKPELVFEAGTRAISPDGSQIDSGLHSLSLLTTNKKFFFDGSTPLDFDTTHGTSPATAQSAGMAARIMARHPDLWPETVRALMVHSAEWTPVMEEQLAAYAGKTGKIALLRQFGYGVPKLERALSSAQNDVALIAESTIQPFHRVRENGNWAIKLRDIHYYELPWPRRTLESLEDRKVQLKVALSYFIEPNPGSFPGPGDPPRRYRSYGFRFDLKRSTETEARFKSRINAAAPDEAADAPHQEDQGWFFGTKIPSVGSLHCDVWEGSAADLAARDQIAVFPVTGWWYSNPRHQRYNDSARYSLIVSLSVPDLDVDLYTEITQAIRIEPETEIPI